MFQINLRHFIYLYSETLNKEYIERNYQMSFSKSPDNRMPQIFSFFYWIFIWSSLKLSPQSPHISRLFLYFYKKKKPKKLLFGQKYYFQQRNFDIFLVSYIYPFVKHRAASSVGSHDIDSCKLISVKKSLNCAHYTLIYTHKHINMRYTLLQKSYIVQEFFKLEERPTITVNEQISLAQDKYRLKFGNPVPSLVEIVCMNSLKSSRRLELLKTGNIKEEGDLFELLKS